MTFVITGDDGSADEDLACAEYIAALLDDENPDPARFVTRAAGSRAAVDLRTGYRNGHTGIHERDIETCLDVDRFSFSLVATNAATHVSLRARA